jgi:hypothetical protein
MALFAPLPAQESFYPAKPSALACAPVSPPAPTGDATQDKHAAQMARETLDAEFRASRLQRLCQSLSSLENCPDPNYVNTMQGGAMQKSWRRKVAEWLLEFVDEFGLPNDIVAVAVAYLDIFLSRRRVNKASLQLLAMVCIFVASKFHEVDPISIAELQTLAEGGYTEEQIRSLELELLQAMSWNMNPTTTHKIMRHVANFADASVRWELLEHAEGYCDYSLTDYSFLQSSRASIAIAAVLCSLTNIGRPQDVGPILAEMRRLGVVQPYMEAEIARVRTKLLEIFYKNFPHLRPTTPATRSNSPTGVDAIFAVSSRCASPAPPAMSAGKVAAAGVQCGAPAVTPCQAQFQQQAAAAAHFHHHAGATFNHQAQAAAFSTASAFGAAH